MATINGDANDNVLNGTDGSDTIDGQGGNDTIDGGREADTIDGGDGDDTIFGGVGIDIVTGGAGDDVISGGSGNDTIYEGAGNDFIDGDDAASNPGNDLVSYENVSAGVNVSLLITTAQDTGGGGVDTLVRVERLTGSNFNDTLTGLAISVLRGLDGDDILRSGQELQGGAGNDVLSNGHFLFGQEGDDILDASGPAFGNAGSMSGGTGNDTYYVDSIDDEVIESGLGTDLIITTLTSYVLAADLENLTGTTAAMLTFAGNLAANAIAGNLSDDLLDGRDGNDMLAGQAGDDDLRGGAGDDTILGGDGDDIVAGGSGNDTVDGGAGDDRVDGGSGNDSLDGGAGYDILTGGSGDDTITSAAGADTIDGGSGNDLLNGGARADTLFGREGDDTLNGGVGADTLVGGLDNDTYRIDSAGDRVVELAGEGTDRVTSYLSSYTLAENVENLTGMLDSGQTLVGNAMANRIAGNAGSDRIEGATGRDTMSGGAGPDLFIFRDGDTSAARNTADRITDFSQADLDRIRVHEIDANTALAGDQNFTFIGNGAFTGVAGQLHYAQQGAVTYVEGDTNGDSLADFVIRLDGVINLAAGDFVL